MDTPNVPILVVILLVIPCVFLIFYIQRRENKAWSRLEIYCGIPKPDKISWRVKLSISQQILRKCSEIDTQISKLEGSIDQKLIEIDKLSDSMRTDAYKIVYSLEKEVRNFEETKGKILHSSRVLNVTEEQTESDVSVVY